VQPTHDHQLGLGPAATPPGLPVQPLTGAQLVGRLSPAQPGGPGRGGDVAGQG
jgi:hypothetical protein